MPNFTINCDLQMMMYINKRTYMLMYRNIKLTFHVGTITLTFTIPETTNIV